MKFKIDLITGVNEKENFMKEVAEFINKNQQYKIVFELKIPEGIEGNVNIPILEGDYPFIIPIEKILTSKYKNIRGYKHSLLGNVTPRYLMVMPICQEMGSEEGQKDEGNNDKE